ncbi:M36 family metallopeptidase [Conexibacter sp. CPCC 206217]|uniref:M36 family metallopeptidase n=1 Tax=Conexibacter sp. CPCC 206217 TaxID=3064574 RepID=UPI0027175DDF|nr:M36 family metallopeptidase [Conexibacter sp. CPCC 206217]MDO8213087.1 M36 family metallopeptidase [Conexibacter sp. CPCC 206217]
MHRLRRIAALAATSAVTAALTAAPALAVQAQDPGRPQLDVRAGKRAPVPAATDRARDALAQRLGTEASLSVDRTSGGIRAIGRTDGFLTSPSGDDAAAVALGYVRDHPVVFGLDGDDLAALRLLSRTTSGDGVTHLTWMQTSDGVEAYDSVLNANVTSDGRLLSIGGAPSADLSIATATPALTASQALRIVQRDVGGTLALPRADARPGAERRTTFSNGDAARLVAFAAPDGDRLAWRVTVAGEQPFLYDVVVDAHSGELLARNSLTDFASAQVYDFHPGAAPADTVDLARWLGDTQGDTRLFGPNAHAYADVGAPNGVNAGEQVAATGGNWSYPLQQVAPAALQYCSPFGGGAGICTWDGSNRASETTNRSQTTAQLFYYVNTYHDWLAQAPIGFDAGSRNFEGGDRVLAEADDYSGLNNANMSTPTDGQSPRMQMYLFSNPFPAVNSGDDASVVYHEYTHGLSNRLVAGGTGSQLARQQGSAMGEGWSDWYAFDYLVATGIVADTAADGEIAVGEYVTGNTLTGIRREALDCSVGSAAPACAGTSTSGRGGFSFDDLGRVGASSSGPRFEVHDDGEIWAQTLWDLRKAVGATTARGLVTNAMRLTTVDNPSFLDERDAILQADLATGGRDHDTIWQVFANRGMGYGASVTDPNATRATASFALPSLTSASRPALDDAAPIGDGDGVLEPGEAARLSVQLDNPAAIPLTNVRATLSGSAGVVVGTSRVGYGTIAAGARAGGAAPFAVTLPAAAQCGAPVALALHVSTDQGDVSLPLRLPVGSGWEPLASASNLAAPIPDGDPNGVTRTLSVGAGRAIAGLRVTLSITHTYGNDLRALLTSPSGTTVELLSQPGSWNAAFDGFAGVQLDDGASASIQNLPSGDLPAVSGRFRPDEPLARFDGEPRAGSWTLRVLDSVRGDTGSLTAWSLDAGQPACATTAPALPLAATGDASGVAAAAATLAGTLDPAGAATDYAFEYGTTTDYGSTTPAASAGAGSGASARSTAVGGLAASTTYHFRIVALRGGTVVALGEDRSFTTPAAPVDGPGGGGDDGGTPGPGDGGTPGPGDGGTPGPGAGGTPGPGAGGTPTPGGGLAPPARPTTPAATVGTLPPKLTLNARNAFTLTFRATPAKASGTVRFTLPKQKRRAAIAFSAPFAVSARGTVKISLTVRGTALRRLRQLGSARTTVTIALGGRTFRRTLTLKRAPARRRG